jgi:hypothetical protein
MIQNTQVKLIPGLPRESTQQEEVSSHQQTGLKFMERTSEVLICSTALQHAEMWTL